MADRARKQTDAWLKKLEKEIAGVYRQSQDEITAAWNAYMTQGQERLDRLWQAYQNAPAGQRRAAKQAWQEAMRNYTLQNQQYRAMVEDVTYKIAHANEMALAYVNNSLPDIYALNYNQPVPGIAGMTGIDFTLVDASTVRRMIIDGDIQLPYHTINIPRDQLWNTRKLNSAVLQGILQGESMQDIAERILPIVNYNQSAAIRNARTMVTGAENRGRLDRYNNLSDQGLIMNKVWLATNDGRTRDWHLSMDGQEVGIKEMFIDGLGNELEYPGDPGAEPETVYNCRCSMISNPIGIRGANGKIRYF